MSIHTITKDRFNHMFATEKVQAEKRLHVGQIVEGKIIKLFPNNKAQIQLGSQVMVAQLEASLSAGERYHFQVQSSGELIHLKVVGNHLVDHPEVNVQNLLQSLNLKANKVQTDFVQTLMEEKIPFDRARLVQSFELLTQAKRNPNIQGAIQQILSSGLPLTEATAQAVQANQTNNFTDELKTMIRQLKQMPKQTPLTKTLLSQLAQLTNRPVAQSNIVGQQIMSLPLPEQQQFLQLFQNLGFVNHDTTLSTWQTELLPSHPSSNQNQTLQLNFPEVQQALVHMSSNQSELQRSAQLFLDKWEPMIQQSLTSNQSSLSTQTELVYRELTKQILPLLSSEHMEKFQVTQNTRPHLQDVLLLLQSLANESTFTKADQLLALVNDQAIFLNSSVKEQFLAHIQQVLVTTGLSYEHNLATGNMDEQQVDTVKSILIQLTQQQDSSTSERAQQLLHVINGMQIQSVSETNNFIHASLIVPGEKLNLNKDLFFEFESKKTEDGKINSDYCRILFYLDLTNLKETIVDMNVQKRHVTVTIFNENEHIKRSIGSLQQPLKEGLTSLGYQLTTVLFKPIEEVGTNNQQNLAIKPKVKQNSYEGFDYRV